jgi:hypothetical protein
MTGTVGTPGGFARARFLGAALLLAIGSALAQAPAAVALSCSGDHQIILDQGTVTPVTGPASGGFTFSVRYRDSASCAPRVVNLRVPGVGTFGMRAAGTNYKAGVVYSRTLELAKGVWTYSFAAASGAKAGAKSVVLTKVEPARVTVTAPVSQPVTEPVPSPSKRPAAGSPRPTPRPAVSVPPRDDDGASGFQVPAIFGGPMGGVVGPWLVLTAVGVAIFWVLLRRRPESPVPAGAATSPAAGMGAPGRPAPGEESVLPRWLRPSLQAARQAGWGVPPPRAAVRFRDPAAPGVDRREIGYRLVRVADGPDDLGSEEIGRFDRGDQVEILETKGPFVRVRGADGLEGWVQQAAIVSILDN